MDKENKDIVLNQEQAVMKTSECLGNSYTVSQDYTKFFNYFVDSDMINRSYLLEMVSDGILIMTSDLTNLMTKILERIVALSLFRTALDLDLEIGSFFLTIEYNNSSLY